MKLAGWERTYGRAPTADDLIIPTRNLTGRQSPESQSALLGDLAELGLRRRRGHDLRRTFITLAQVDGARRDLLETITHGPRGDIINIYTSFPWPALCAEVAKLKIDLREGLVLDGDFRGLATPFATVQRTARKRWIKSATPAGFETARSSAKHDEDSRSPTENTKAAPTSRKLVGADSSKVAKLALLASNAVKNFDLHRAEELLSELLQITGMPALAAASVRASKGQSEGASKQSEGQVADFRSNSEPATANHRTLGAGKGRAV